MTTQAFTWTAAIKRGYRKATSLTDAIDKLAIAHSIAYLGVRTDADKWTHDAWQVTIQDASTTYRTGVGHRVGLREYRPHNDQEARGYAWRTPVTPHLAEVLQSLALDESCASGTFEDFCGDTGADPDSRKALASYLACQESGLLLRRLSDSKAVRAALAEFGE